MSRKIDLTKPLSEDEIEYLETRDWQHKLAQNAENITTPAAPAKSKVAKATEAPAEVPVVAEDESETED